MKIQELREKNNKANELRINGEINECGMAYKIADEENNVFVFDQIENGFPVYRCNGGSKHIFELTGYKVIERYISLA